MKLIDLLTSLGQTMNILVYLDTYNKARSLLASLCRATKKFNENNEKAFSIMFEDCKTPLKYTRTFDQELAELLFDQNRYFDYSLDVFVSTEESLEILLTFIEKVEHPSMLKFTKITSPTMLYNSKSTAKAIQGFNFT